MIKNKIKKKLKIHINCLQLFIFCPFFTHSECLRNDISKISDVKWATIEQNGQLGFILKEEAQGSTKLDIQTLKKDIEQLKKLVNQMLPTGSYVQQQMNTPNQQTDIIEKLQKQINELNNQQKCAGEKRGRFI